MKGYANAHRAIFISKIRTKWNILPHLVLRGYFLSVIVGLALKAQCYNFSGLNG